MGDRSAGKRFPGAPPVLDMLKRTALGLSTVLVLSTASVLLAAPASAASTGFGEVDQVTRSSSVDLGLVSTAVGPDGRTLVAWDDYDSSVGAQVVFYRWYTPGTGWSTTNVLSDAWGGQIWDPAVAASGNGDFVMAAVVAGGISDGISVWHYFADEGYMGSLGSPVDIAFTDLASPAVAIDGSGNSVVAWLENDGTFTNLSACRYARGTGFQSAQVLDTFNATPQRATVKMDAAGDVVALWQQNDGTYNNLYGAASVAGTDTWSLPQELDTYDAAAVNAVLAMNEAGIAVAAYLQNNGTSGNMYSVAWASSGGWGVPEQVSDDQGGVGGVSISLVGGTLAASWNQYFGLEYQVMAATYLNGTWSTPTNLSSAWPDGGGDSSTVACADSGTCLVLWSRYNTTHPATLWASWSRAGSAWSVPTPVSPGNGDRLDDPLLAMNDKEEGFVLWTVYDGYGYAIVGRPLSPPDSTPPLLEVSAPTEGQQLGNATVLVCGLTEPGIATIEVHGYRASPDSTGEFCLWVALHAGNNTLWVIATDAAGNEARTSRTVTFNDPVPGLQQEVAAAQAAADDAHAHLHEAEADLAATQGELDATQIELAAARHQLNVTNGTVDTLESNQATQAAALQQSTAAATAAAASAAMMGLLALIVGAVGAAMALLAMRKGAGGGGSGGGSPVAAPAAELGGGQTPAPQQPMQAPPGSAGQLPAEPPKSG